MEKIMQHRLATPVFQPRMYFFDADGKPLVGGKVYSFKVGADEFKPTYRNSEFTAANQNPVLLDQAGSALIYVRGSNQLKIYNKQGSLIEEKIVYQQQMQTQFFDSYGKTLSSGKIWTYDYQSTIKKASYKNADENLLNSNPVILDQNGWGSISIIGAYRLRVLDKSNVVVGDQDFKRLPVQVLTSRVYPLYFEEGINTSFDLSTSTIMQMPKINEDISTKFSILNAIIREPMNSQPIEIENLSLDFGFVGATIEDTRSKYQSIALQFDDINPSFSLSSAQIVKQIGFITHTMRSEAISSSFSLSSAQIIN